MPRASDASVLVATSAGNLYRTICHQVFIDHFVTILSAIHGSLDDALKTLPTEIKHPFTDVHCITVLH